VRELILNHGRVLNSDVIPSRSEGAARNLLWEPSIPCHPERSITTSVASRHAQSKDPFHLNGRTGLKRSFCPAECPLLSWTTSLECLSVSVESYK
jgi:hypothetical protein